MHISKHRVVSIDYTLTNTSGEVLDSSEGQAPLTYLHGAGNIISGLEKALEGKTEGDSLSVSIEPAEAYGERLDALCQTVPRAAFQGVEELEIGMRFQAQNEDQDMVIFTVTNIAGEQVTIDGNHPLAGETLHFEVAVTEVREASEEEISHGHVHGPDGHHH